MSDKLYLEEWLNQLNGRDQVICLAIYMGYKQKEVAILLSLSSAYVSKRISYLKEKYKKFYNIS